jgi:hypothetical protein
MRRPPCIGGILNFAKSQDHFQMKDVVILLPEILRRTLERDVESLVKRKKLFFMPNLLWRKLLISEFIQGKKRPADQMTSGPFKN